jgi:hypothetical protein
MTDNDPGTGEKRRKIGISFRRLRQKLDCFTADSDGRNDRPGYLRKGISLCNLNRKNEAVDCFHFVMIEIVCYLYLVCYIYSFSKIIFFLADAHRPISLIK